jgi:PPOX class probable F420-dependent enzyme
MIDFTSRLGRHVKRRLRKEQIIWLTTVDFNDAPQPRPVWFHWDDETILIFSERGKAKLRHIERNPEVSLNFNTDEDGGDVAVIGCEARIMDAPPASKRVTSYLRKYREGIKSLDMTVAEFSAAYTVPILVTPKALRGFVE